MEATKSWNHIKDLPSGLPVIPIYLGEFFSSWGPPNILRFLCLLQSAVKVAGNSANRILTCVVLNHVQLFGAPLWGPLDCSLPGSSVHGILFFFRQEYWSGLPFPPPQGLPVQGLNPCLLHLPHCQADSLPPSCLGNPRKLVLHALKWTSRLFVTRSTMCQVVYFHSKQLPVIHNLRSDFWWCTLHVLW